jgi:hypothetical protein
MRLLDVKPSTAKGKKYMAIFCPCDGPSKCKGKRVHFGSSTSQTYLDHHDKTKRENYLKRHSKNSENWNNPATPGALSRWLLWGDSTSLMMNIKEFKKKFSC